MPISATGAAAMQGARRRLSGASAPVNTSPPTISGAAYAGGTLTASPGTWTGADSFTYQWRGDGVDIVGATSSTYLVALADEGKDVTVRVTGTGPGGSASAESAGVVIGGITTSDLVIDWYVDPARITTVDDSGTTRISAIADPVGGYDVSHSTMGQRPEYLPTGLNGRPGASFSASRGDVLFRTSLPNLSARPLTIYAWLTQPALTAGSRFVIDVQSGRIAVACQSNTAGIDLGVFDGSWRVFGDAATGNQSLVYTLVGGTNTATCHRNGVLVGSASYTERALGAIGASSVALGGAFTGGSGNSITAIVGRVLIYDGAHDAETRERNLAVGAAIYGFGA